MTVVPLDTGKPKKKKEGDGPAPAQPILRRDLTAAPSNRIYSQDGWIKSYMRYVDGTESPKNFHLWTAASCVAGALQRRVWVQRGLLRVFPNLYVVLVGPASVGKSTAIKFGIHDLLFRLPFITTAAQALTKERLFEHLHDCQQQILVGNEQSIWQASITMAPMELGVFLGRRNFEFLDALNDLWDSPDKWRYETKNSGKFAVPGPCLNLIGGTTPQWLAEGLTPEVFQTGFSARTILIYAKEPDKLVPFPIEADTMLANGLVHDLECISMLKGEFVMVPRAKQLLVDWYRTGMPPKPRDTRLDGYCGRRFVQVLKLAMIWAASDNNNAMLITEQNVTLARDMLLEAEKVMGGALSAFGKNPMRQQQFAIVSFVVHEFEKTKQPVSDAKIRRHVWKDVPPSLMDDILRGLVAMEILDARGSPPVLSYTPGRVAKAALDHGEET